MTGERAASVPASEWRTRFRRGGLGLGGRHSQGREGGRGSSSLLDSDGGRGGARGTSSRKALFKTQDPKTQDALP